MKIIGVAGRKGSGKDTFAQPLLAGPGWVRLRFADALKSMLRALLYSVGMNSEMIERYMEGDLKETPIALFDGKTMRELMQTLGTEWGRNLIVNDLWLRVMGANLDIAAATDVVGIIVTDCRFPDEVGYLQQLGGYIVRVNRPRTAAQLYSNHISETQIDQLPVDLDIENNTDIASLHAMALRIADTMAQSIL